MKTKASSIYVRLHPPNAEEAIRTCGIVLRPLRRGKRLELDPDRQRLVQATLGVLSELRPWAKRLFRPTNSQGKNQMIALWLSILRLQQEFEVSYQILLEKSFNQVLGLHWYLAAWIVTRHNVENILGRVKFQVTDQDKNISDIRWLTCRPSDSSSHAFHRQQVFRNGHCQNQIFKLRKSAFRGLVAGRYETFHPIVQPVGGETLLLCNDLCQNSNPFRR